MISRFLMTACVLAASGCGAVNEGREIDRASGASEEWELDGRRNADRERIEYAGISGEPVVVELGGAVAIPSAPLPIGATIVGERLEWTPSAGQEGEHVIALDVLRDGSFEPTIVRVAVAPGDTSIEYGGCECGSRPNPPRPKAEALGVLLLAAWFRQKRRAA